LCPVLAMYYLSYDTFMVSRDKEMFTLDITHWIEIPTIPLKEV
jgi:hypothetical protein